MRWLTGVILLTVTLLMGLLFTPFGNAALKPLIESQLQERIAAPARLEQFSLGLFHLNMTLHIAKADRIVLHGAYSIFDQSVDMTYAVDVHDLSLFNALMPRPLQGPLQTSGTIVGERDSMAVQGRGSLIQSRFDYIVSLQDFEPKGLNIQGDLKLQEILHATMFTPVADADIALHADIQRLDLNRLERSTGEAFIKVNEGRINTKAVRQEYNMTLADTPFAVDINLTMAQSEADIVMDARIAEDSKIACDTTFHAATQSVDGMYRIDIKDLSLLSAIAGIPLHGPFHTNGTVKGNHKQTTIEGDGGIVSTQVQYSLFLEKFKAKRLKLNGDVALHELLYLAAQPIYARADINLLVAMSNLEKEALTGVVKTQVNSGTLNSVLLQRDFNLSVPLTTFKAEATTQIVDSVASSSIDMISTIASLQTQETLFSMKDGTFHSDYKVIVDDLNALQFVTQRPLRGGATVTGEVTYRTDLEVTAHSDILGGNIDALLRHNKLSATLQEGRTTALSNMLMLPNVFASTINATLDYNLLSNKGRLAARLAEGKIQPNVLTRMLQRATRFDLTQEVYEMTELNSTIDNQVVTSNLSMHSRLTTIKARDAVLNLRRNRIDATLDMILEHYRIPVTVHGDIDAPHIGMDANKMFQDEGKERLKELIDTKLDDALSPEAKALLKGLLH